MIYFDDHWDFIRSRDKRHDPSLKEKVIAVLCVFAFAGISELLGSGFVAGFVLAATVMVFLAMRR
jgi:hypothetical protein